MLQAIDLLDRYDDLNNQAGMATSTPPFTAANWGASDGGPKLALDRYLTA